MKEILVREEHIHRVRVYTERVAELIQILDTADSRDQWEKAKKERIRIDTEFWDFFIPRYKVYAPCRSLIETPNHDFYILNGTEAEVEKRTGLKRGDSLSQLRPDLPLKLD